MPYPSKKIRQNPFTSLRVIRRTDRQIDRQTDRTKNITSFFGGGNYVYCLCTETVLIAIKFTKSEVKFSLLSMIMGCIFFRVFKESFGYPNPAAHTYG